jgi:putative hydrolase of the HAD superfamily
MIDFSLIKTIPADVSHYEFIYRLKKEAYYDYITRIWGWDEDAQRQFYAQEWQKLKPGIILYNKRLIGSICVWNDNKNIYIERFYILPDYQNKGIGSHLVKTILDRADKEGLVARLHVLKINPAISLYKRHGYEVISEDEIMYQMERKPESGSKNTLKYQAVIFDLFGTLVDIFSVREYENVLLQMTSSLRADYYDFHKIWMRTAKQRTTGTLGTLEENLRYICRELKISVTKSQIKEATRVRHNYVARALTPRQDAIEVVSSLKSAGYKIGLISNCSTEPPLIWPNTPFAPFFDIALFSSVVGINKPDQRIFQMAVEQLNVEPSKCIYIGDGGDNELAAAAEIGMTPVLIRVPHENNADALRPNDDAINFTGPKISSLKEVLNLVQYKQK